MNPSVKVILYVVLGLGALFSARGFYTNYSSAVNSPSEPPLPTENDPPTEEVVDEKNRTGQMMWYGAGLLLTSVGLALLASHDVSRFVANRAEDMIFSSEGEAMQDPEYEQAEVSWADGQFLNAIQLMREHLKKNPRHQFAAIRIAEIYEKDLDNPVAAALEYEQILNHKLPPERWGWAAIHLANLYSGRLGKIDQAEALLRRIIDDYGQTAAAKKARVRLGEPEPEPESPEQDEAEESQSPPPPPPSNLPPGFRPKKG